MTSEVYWLVKEARTLDYLLEVEEGGYRATYEGSLVFLCETYPSTFFEEQDAISAWLEQVEHAKALYLRNLNLAKKVEEIENGKLPAYAWPGGYPIYYYTDDGSMFCPDCAQDGEEVTTGEVYWEGPAIECDGYCGKMLESAYGDPEEEKDD